MQGIVSCASRAARNEKRSRFTWSMKTQKQKRNNLCNQRNLSIFRLWSLALRIFHRDRLLVVALPLSLISSATAQVIPAPFGLKWGEASAPILSFAEHTGSKIETQSGSSGRETIEVRGPFSNQRYQRLGFTFQADRLVQVAVYYQAPEESDKARELLAALRGEIEQSFGPGAVSYTHLTLPTICSV